MLLRDPTSSEPKLTRKVKTPHGDLITVTVPGRAALTDVFEYSQRRTMLNNGRRIERDTSQQDPAIASAMLERDRELSTCPLLSMIRNPRCGYHVPYISHAESNIEV